MVHVLDENNCRNKKKMSYLKINVFKREREIRERELRVVETKLNI